MKKLLSLVLVLAVVLSSMSFAFAAAVNPTAVSSDVTNADEKAAVERLAGLGLVAGMDDGKYHPSDKVTREQCAKLVVEALGLGAAAEAAKGSSPFSDVEADRWSSGYISVAAGQGIILGVGNGKFAPAAEVTYAQAITMIVRALGYNDAFLKGTWPGNYIAKAANLDVTDKVTFSPAGIGTRGSIAVMLNNALDVKPISQSSWGDNNNWSVSGNTLLKDKVGITKQTKARVTAVPKTDSSLKSNEIKVAGATEKVLQVGLDLNSLLNKEVIGYENGDNDTTYLSVETGSSDVIFGMVSNTKNDTTNKIKIKTADGTETEYDIIDAPTVFVNNASANDFAEAQFATDDAALEYKMYGTFVKNGDGKIAYADVYSFENSSPLFVTDVDATNKYFKGYAASSDSKVKVDLTEDDGYKMFGAAAKVEDLKANDVAYVKNDVADNGKTYQYIYVVRNSVAGKLERTNSDATELKIAGKTYNAKTAVATCTLDNAATINDLTVANIDDNVTKDITAYLDLAGEVRHTVSSVGGSTEVIYGVIDNVFTNNDGKSAMRAYLPATDSYATYTFSSTDYAGLTAALKGDAVAFTVDADNKIKKIADIEAGSLDAIGTVKAGLTVTDIYPEAGGDGFNSDYDYILSYDNSTRYYVATSSLFADATLLDALGAAKDPKVVKWADIEDKNPINAGDNNVVAGTDTKLVAVMDGTIIKYAAFTNNYAAIASDYKYGVVTDRFFDGDQKATISVDGVATTIKVDDSFSSSVKNGDVLVYSTNADGKINAGVRAVHGSVYATALNALDFGACTKFEAVSGSIKSFSGGVLTLKDLNYANTSGGTTKSFSIGSDVEVWKAVYDGVDDDSDITVASQGDLLDEVNITIIMESDGMKPKAVIIRKAK